MCCETNHLLIDLFIRLRKQVLHLVYMQNVKYEKNHELITQELAIKRRNLRKWAYLPSLTRQVNDAHMKENDSTDFAIQI